MLDLLHILTASSSQSHVNPRSPESVNRSLMGRTVAVLASLKDLDPNYNDPLATCLAQIMKKTTYSDLGVYLLHGLNIAPDPDTM